jgi:hypothetical protein
LETEYIPLRLNTDDQPSVAKKYDVVWTPTLVLQHHLGVRLRSWIGYLPPAEFLAQLKLGLALSELRSARAEAAYKILQEIHSRDAEVDIAAEAMYWQGIAAYRRTKAKDALWAIWLRLVERFPGSTWARRTTLLEAEIPDLPVDEP